MHNQSNSLITFDTQMKTALLSVVQLNLASSDDKFKPKEKEEV